MGTSSDLVREWFERVWNNGDASYIDKAICSECELTGLDSETIKSPADFHRFHQMLTSLFSDMTIVINHLIDAGDTFAGVVTVNGTRIATDRPVSFRSSCFGTLREGQIYHVTNLVDYLSVLIQVGALPSEVIAQGLAGEATL